MAASDNSLLGTELGDEETEALYQKLLLQASELQGLNPEQAPAFNTVAPEPGFCLKTKNGDGEKVFINICQSPQIPAPQEVSEAQLTVLLDADHSDYRIPMSIGEPHAELDKGGKGCTAYDVVINPSFLDKINDNMMFQGFFLTVCLQGLEHKYDMSLDRNYVILKNRKFLGTPPDHFIRTKSKPRIQEVDTDGADTPEEKSKKLLITEIEDSKENNANKGPEPEYLILREPPEGHPEFLVAEIQLPKVKSCKTLTLDLGEDRILLHAHPNNYHLDIYLPYDVNQEESGAQFNKHTKVLTLTLPVQPI